MQYYTPIESAEETAERIAGFGLFNSFVVYIYDEQWQREEGELAEEREDDVRTAVDKFLEACHTARCAELRGVGSCGQEESLCIGGTAPDLREEGEFIEWSELD